MPLFSYKKHSNIVNSTSIMTLFSCSVVSDSLQCHGLQHTKLPYLSPSPRAYSNSCPLSWWCHPTISSFVVPFSSCLQSFLASASRDPQFLGGQSSGSQWGGHWAQPSFPEFSLRECMCSIASVRIWRIQKSRCFFVQSIPIWMPNSC